MKRFCVKVFEFGLSGEQENYVDPHEINANLLTNSADLSIWLKSIMDLEREVLYSFLPSTNAFDETALIKKIRESPHGHRLVSVSDAEVLKTMDVKIMRNYRYVIPKENDYSDLSFKANAHVAVDFSTGKYIGHVLSWTECSEDNENHLEMRGIRTSIFNLIDKVLGGGTYNVAPVIVSSVLHLARNKNIKTVKATAPMGKMPAILEKLGFTTDDCMIYEVLSNIDFEVEQHEIDFAK